MASDRRVASLVFAALTLLVAVLAARPSAAQGEPGVADKEQARELMKKGDAYMDAGQPGPAFDAYQAADKLMGVPITRLWMCKAQEAEGKLLEARDTCLSVRNLPKRTDPEPDPFVQARNEAEQVALAIKPRLASILLQVDGGTPGAAISVQLDGAAVPDAILTAPRPANPGAHTIVVSDGTRRGEAQVELREGEQKTVAIVLTDAQGQPAPGPGVPGGPASRSGGISPLVWVGVGVAAAGLIVGAVAGGIAAARASDIHDQCPDDQCDLADTALADDYDAALVSAHVATAGFAVAGVGVVLGVVGFIIGGGRDSSEGARIEPWVGLGSAGLRGTF